jgi:glycine amidinotransferase
VDGLMAKFGMCSPSTSINVLMLDHRRVAVEASQPTLHRALKDCRFEPLPLPFLAYGPFGGAFHCASFDTRRRGALRDYF